MAMEGVGLGLAVLAEVRTLAVSLRERWTCYKDGPLRFATVDDNVVAVLNVLDEIVGITSANTEVFPSEISGLFQTTLAEVRGNAIRSCEMLDIYCSKAFGNSSGGAANIAKKAMRVFKAKSLATALKEIEKGTAEVKNTLHHLLTQLVVVLKSDAAEDIVRNAIKKQISPSEVFHPAFNAPLLSGSVRLDFESKDMEGDSSSPEGQLKSLVFQSTTSTLRSVTIARGASFPMHAVSGMAGVGKTTALIGLGHDTKIHEHFKDGVLFMSLGAEADVEKITSELDEIMRATGATSSAAAVKSASSLGEAVSKAAIWFQGRCILFMFDDIWPSPMRADGFLPDVQGILKGSPDSRIVISTRSRVIAANLGSHVDFGSRDPHGPVSVAMFLSHASPNVYRDVHECGEIRGILNLCAGLPIALAVAGQAVALRVTLGLGFQSACRTYLDELSKEMYPGASFLSIAIHLSLHALDGKFKTREPQLRYSVSEMYASLCVLKNQQFAPVSVLACMWKIDKGLALHICLELSSMSLAKMSGRSLEDGSEQNGILVHDLHLNYCRHAAEKRDESAEWHRRLLDGHIERDCCKGSDDIGEINVFHYVPRPWWKEHVENKEYIRSNLSRHLQRADLKAELAASLLNIHWINAQATSGGILALQSDFESALNVFDGDSISELVLRDSIGCILRVLEESSADLRGGLRVISFILFSRLFDLSKENVFLQQFLNSVKNCTPTPFLEPIVATFQPPGKHLKRTIVVPQVDHDDRGMQCVDFSKCQKYIVAALRSEVVVMDLKSQHILQNLKDNELYVFAVIFSMDASKIIIALSNKTIYVWEWKTSDAPSMELCGHTGFVNILALNSDGSKLFSGSRNSAVKVWNMATGSESGEYQFESGVSCIALCSTKHIVAVGTEHGRIQCINWESRAILSDIVMVNEKTLRSLQFSPNGEFLAAGSCGGEIASWSTVTWMKEASASLDGSIEHITFHANGTTVALVGSWDKIFTWSVKGGTLSTLQDRMHGRISGILYVNNGNEIVVGYVDGFIRFWSSSSMGESLDDVNYLYSVIQDFCLSLDGTRAAELNQFGVLRLWDTVSGERIAKYHVPVDTRVVALASDGKSIATGSRNGSIRIWTAGRPGDADNVRLEYGDLPILGLSFSPDGKALLVVHDFASIWDLKAGKKLGDVGVEYGPPAYQLYYRLEYEQQAVGLQQCHIFPSGVVYAIRFANNQCLRPDEP